MRRALLRNASLYTRSVFPSPPSFPSSLIPKPSKNVINKPPISSPFSLFCSDSSDPNPNHPPPPAAATAAADESSLVNTNDNDPDLEKDVSNQELKSRIEKYFKGDEEALPSILEAILARKLSGQHEYTDDEITEELRFTPLDSVDESEFESDFDEAHETDEDIPDLYNARDIVVKRMMKDEYFNMDDKKWNDIVQEATEKGIVGDMKECEEILQDMQNWDTLLPDDMKQKVQAKFDELGDKCEREELEPEEAYEQFKVFEDQIVAEYIKNTEQEAPSPSDTVAEPVKKKSDDPPGVGPILRWHSRVVFTPGGDAWHPKNRKVKLSVTVKELGLSKYQFRRLRDIVGKRYHPGKDELTITSERYEHREENRKDCLRTLLNIIEEAGKADALVDEARTSYVKQRLKANPAFMARLHAKTKQASTPATA